MTETSKLIPVRVLAVLALAAAACSVEAGNQIPCVEDSSCPNDYPVCGPNAKCIAGSSTAQKSVAVVGAEGHAATDFLSGTVRVIVSAKASSGVESVTLAAGSITFTASTPAATPPLYAFDVDTTALADGDRQLTATLTAGDKTTATANGTLHVDNAKPVITIFSVGSFGTSATVTAGESIAINASFTGGTTATISDDAGGSVSIPNDGSVLVSPDVLTTYSLVVTSRSGVSVRSGTTGQPPDVSVAVAQPASKSGGNFSVDRTVIDHNDTGTLTFTAPTFSSAFTGLVKGPDGSSVGAIASNGTLANVPVPAMTASTTQLTYTLVISNGASNPNTLSIPLVVTVRPHISAFTFGSGGPTATTVDPGDAVSLTYNYSGAASANINGVNAPLPGPLSFSNLQASTVYTLTVTNSAGISSTQTATATVRAKIYSFTVGATQAASNNQVIITAGGSTTLFASFAGSATANADLSCNPTPACTSTLPTPAKISNGGTATITPGTGTFSYSLTVTPSAGASPVTSSPVTVKVVPLATADGLTAARSIIHSGGSTTLTPIFDVGTSSAAPGSATIVGLDDLGGTTTYSGLTTGTDINVAPLVSTTYSLQVKNGAGLPAAGSPPTVRVNVAKGTWSALNSNAIDVRRGATVTALDSGKVLIAGGLNNSGSPTTAAYLCDATGACMSKTMNTARAFHTATRITAGTNNNKVLIAAGTGASGALKSAELFDGDPSVESFSNTTDIGPAASARSHHIAVLLGDGSTVLIAGGNDGSVDVKTAIKYDTNTTPNPTATALASLMTQTRADFTGTLLDVAPTANSKVLIVGGHATDFTAELFDPAGPNTFTATTNPLGEDKRGHTAVLIGGTGPNIGKVLISGGATGSGAGSASSTQYLFNPTGQTFTQTASLLTSRSGQAATFVPTDTVLLCGGTTDGTNPIASCERYDGSAETQGPTAPMLQPRRDFGLAPITLSSVLEYLAAGGLDSAPSPGTAFAETYNPN
jgi:hypothetical protein